MDAIREQLSKPLVAGIIGFVLGLVLGWFVIGWGLWPVEYVGAGPADMRMPEKVEYLRMTIEAYGRSGDVQTAQNRFNALGEEKEAALNEVRQSPGNISPDLLNSFVAVVAGGQVPAQTPGATQAVGQTPAPGGVTTPTTAAAEEGGGGSILSTFLTILCVLVLVGAAIVIIFFIIRSRGAAGPGEPTPAMQAREAARQAAWTDYADAGQEPPTAQFMASYKLGDDLFDDSFSIDTPSGEFMGECGVGISETIGVGDPKKVTAFEVWLFDKNDIQTVTKVFMSDHAYDDEATRTRLSAKGEPVLAEPGAKAVLETQTLQMIARVVEMGYGDGALPQDSFFDRFIIELAVWQK